MHASLPLLPCALVSLAATTGAMATQPDSAFTPPDQEIVADEAREADGVRWTLQAGLLHQFETDIDDGGAFDFTQARAGLGATFTHAPNSTLSASISYDRYDYDFTDTGRFGGVDPWEEVNEFGASLLLNQHLSGNWSLIALGFVNVAAEAGADEGDALTGGGGLGLGYRVSPRLTLGFGLSMSTQLEDDPRLLPLVVVDWKINDNARLLAGRIDVASSLGPGFDFGWRLDDSWELGAGVRFRSVRFRLDDEDLAPDGVAEHESVPVYARLTCRFGQGSSIFAFGGAMFGGSLEIENRNGRHVFDEDYDAAPFIGLGAIIRF